MDNYLFLIFLLNDLNSGNFSSTFLSTNKHEIICKDNNSAQLDVSLIETDQSSVCSELSLEAIRLLRKENTVELRKSFIDAVLSNQINVCYGKVSELLNRYKKMQFILSCEGLLNGNEVSEIEYEIEEIIPLKNIVVFFDRIKTICCHDVNLDFGSAVQKLFLILFCYCDCKDSLSKMFKYYSKLPVCKVKIDNLCLFEKYCNSNVLIEFHKNIYHLLFEIVFGLSSLEYDLECIDQKIQELIYLSKKYSYIYG